MTKAMVLVGMLSAATAFSACNDDEDTLGVAGAPSTGSGASAGSGNASGQGGGGAGGNGTGGNGASSGAAMAQAGMGGDGPDSEPGAGMAGMPTEPSAAGAGGEPPLAGAGGDSGAGGESGAGGAPENGGHGGEGPEPDPIEIVGSWSSNFGGTEVIGHASWSTDFGAVAIIAFSNSENVAVRQSPADDLYNPLKFDRTVWTEISGGSFYYCIVDFGLDTAEAALASTTPFDASDPDNTGCGGFSWTKLTLN